jgi:hypothetical protein
MVIGENMNKILLNNNCFDYSFQNGFSIHNEVFEWLKENNIKYLQITDYIPVENKPNCWAGLIWLGFQNRNDAMRFKLRWGGQ